MRAARQAKTLHEQIFAVHPVNLQARYQQALIESTLGNHRQALHHLEQAMEAKPPPEGPSRAKSASRSLRRALLTPQVNTGSRYRCRRST